MLPFITRRPKLVLPLLLLAFLWMGNANAQTVSQAKIGYRPVMQQLSQTRIPLRLPKVLVYPNAKGTYGATVIAASADRYDLNIGDRYPCKGLYCSIATVTAEQIQAGMPSIPETFAFMNDPNYQPLERSPEPMRYVSLATGQQAYFVPWVLGANYGYSKLIWDEAGYRYTVGLKKADLSWLLAVVNSISR